MWRVYEVVTSVYRIGDKNLLGLIFFDCLVKDLRRMKRIPVCSVFDLMPAAGAGCNDLNLFIGFPDLWKEDQFPDLHRQLIMIFFVSEGPGHATTTGRDLLRFKIVRDADNFDGISDRTDGFVVAIAMHFEPLVFICK